MRNSRVIGLLSYTGFCVFAFLRFCVNPTTQQPNNPTTYVTHQRNNAFTLVELLIAMSLVGMILVAVAALDASARRFLQSSNVEFKVQNEISPILERIVKDISRAANNFDSTPGISISGVNALLIRLMDSDDFPQNYANNPWVNYVFVFPEILIRSRISAAAAWSPSTVLADNIVDCRFSFDPAVLAFSATAVRVTITARRNAATASSSLNPEIILQTIASTR